MWDRVGRRSGGGGAGVACCPAVAGAAGLDAALREQIQTTLPDTARTYYCSQLVVTCLIVSSLLPDNVATEFITPTGPFQLLLNRNWTDRSSV